jgi:hypothetical protein
VLYEKANKRGLLSTTGRVFDVRELTNSSGQHIIHLAIAAKELTFSVNNIVPVYFNIRSLFHDLGFITRICNYQEIIIFEPAQINRETINYYRWYPQIHRMWSVLHLYVKGSLQIIGGIVDPQTDTSDPNKFIDMDLTKAAIDITPCDAKMSALP